MSVVKRKEEWSILYEQAIREDGSYWYPERLSEEFLNKQKKLQGTQIFASQYLNLCFPPDGSPFKQEWFKFWSKLPDIVNTFVFIDPALSIEDGSDFTGVAVVSVDADMNWYIRRAIRMRLNPTEVINKLFDINEAFHPMIIGIEDVAFQKALLFNAYEEMKRRGKYLPVTGINHGNQKTKEGRIHGALVPRMEWGSVYFPHDDPMDELKREMLQFPKSTHDDILDSLASCESIIVYPSKEKEKEYDPYNPNSSGYERRVIDDLVRKANREI